jgi:deoxyribodipyrimidine photolyase
MSKKGYLGLILLVGVMAYLNPSEETQKEKIKQVLGNNSNFVSKSEGTLSEWNHVLGHNTPDYDSKRNSYFIFSKMESKTGETLSYGFLGYTHVITKK